MEGSETGDACDERVEIEEMNEVRKNEGVEEGE